MAVFLSSSTPEIVGKRDNGYAKLVIQGSSGWSEPPEVVRAVELLKEALHMRRRYMHPLGMADPACFTALGVDKKEMDLTRSDMDLSIPTPEEYLEAYDKILRICKDGPVVTYAMKRLNILEYMFNFYELLNGKRERESVEKMPADLSTVKYVDTHVHLAACMTESHLLSFIKRKLRNSPDDVVMEDRGKPVTLGQVFRKLNISLDNMNVHMLGCRAGVDAFQRFDNFNGLYNPFGFNELRTIFLKTENYRGGDYFAELVKEVFAHNEKSKKKTEFRVSIYGRNRNEWNDLAAWINKFEVRSKSNKWMIQVPRIFGAFRKKGAFQNFKEFLDNIFDPLVEVSKDPESNPSLAQFLTEVSGFDSVDDESTVDIRISEMIPPEEWTRDENPPYLYYMYHMYARICQVNIIREKMNYNTFEFRPHCGESGSEEHLAAAFLTASGINHGINLEKIPGLQFLYYLCGIGICISPLSNNHLFVNYSDNPFPKFFRRGLNVSLSTDDPLQFHFTNTPLKEEMAIAMRFWKLTQLDLLEICKNSVLMSGFGEAQKRKWLTGKKDEAGDLIRPEVSDVPKMRSEFRALTFSSEVKNVFYRMQRRVSSDILNMSVSESPLESSSYIRLIIKNYKLLPRNRCDADFVVAIPMINKALKLRHLVRDTVVGYEKGSAPSMGYLAAKGDDYELPVSFGLQNGVFYVYDRPNALCSNDESSPATHYCPLCKKWYCAGCFRVFHMKVNLHHHRPDTIDPPDPLYRPIAFEEYCKFYHQICEICMNGPTRTVCWQRNHLLAERFNFHTLLNQQYENDFVKRSGTDFYHITKVDNHVHCNRSMLPGVLLDFIKEKVTTERDTVVFKKFGQKPNVRRDVTLGEAFKILSLDNMDLNLDSLNVRADAETYRRYENWIAKHNPFGKPELRRLFLTTGNCRSDGRYLAELLKRSSFQALAEDPTQKTEMRISVCGKSVSEVRRLAAWAVGNDLLHPSNRFIIQVPRIFPDLCSKRKVTNFGQLLYNIFFPIFEVSRNPKSDPNLFKFMLHVSAFDTVGDESIIESTLRSDMPKPENWKPSMGTPPYAYYMYYLFANLQSLNFLRKKAGLNTFAFRPHSGSDGDVFHLCSAFLLADSISHGTRLNDNPALSYLFYLEQIGVAISPLACSAVHLNYDQVPFRVFFNRGLNVSLATDNPLQLHMTEQPLIEEYATASQMWKLSATDMNEIAFNSVLMSGFSDEEKKAWLGKKFYLAKKNSQLHDETLTALPRIRLDFRKDSMADELRFLQMLDTPK